MCWALFVRWLPRGRARGAWLGLASALLAATAGAQELPARLDYLSVATCRNCHSRELTTSPQQYEPRDGFDPFCRLVQVKTWDEADKHSRAMVLLLDSEPARQLVNRIAGFDLAALVLRDEAGRPDGLVDPQTDEDRRRVEIAKACFRCHATWPQAADDPQAPHRRPVKLADGVSCEACHGPAVAWGTLAHQSPVWRLVKPEVKAQLGFTDVRNPLVKARLCASCHVGSAAEGKFVRHEWYAAGHPPLPGFEQTAFTAQMPPHWQPLAEKGNFRWKREAADPRSSAYLDGLGPVRSAFQLARVEFRPEEQLAGSYIAANSPPHAAGAAGAADPLADRARTREVMVAGLAVLEAYVRLVGAYAGEAAEGKAPWPELALYDCTACHHALRTSLGFAERPQRRTPPGRPPLALWPRVLGEAGTALVSARGGKPGQDAAGRLPGLLQMLDEAATRQPFGDPRAMHAAAEEASEALGEVARAAQHVRYDAAASRQAALWLTDPVKVETRDVAAARQAAWALRGLAADLNLPGAEGLFARGEEDPLALALPSGTERSVLAHLPVWLSAAARYESAWFRAELDDVRRRLGAGPPAP